MWLTKCESVSLVYTFYMLSETTAMDSVSLGVIPSPVLRIGLIGPMTIQICDLVPT